MNYSMYVRYENSMFLKEVLAEMEGGKLVFEWNVCSLPLLFCRHLCATSQNTNLEYRHENCFIIFTQISTQYIGLL